MFKGLRTLSYSACALALSAPAAVAWPSRYDGMITESGAANYIPDPYFGLKLFLGFCVVFSPLIVLRLVIAGGMMWANRRANRRQSRLRDSDLATVHDQRVHGDARQPDHSEIHNALRGGGYVSAPQFED